MVLQYYVGENETGKQIEIDIESATNERKSGNLIGRVNLSAIQSWKSMRRKQMLAKL